MSSCFENALPQVRSRSCQRQNIVGKYLIALKERSDFY